MRLICAAFVKTSHLLDNITVVDTISKGSGIKYSWQRKIKLDIRVFAIRIVHECLRRPDTDALLNDGYIKINLERCQEKKTMSLKAKIGDTLEMSWSFLSCRSTASL